MAAFDKLRAPTALSPCTTAPRSKEISILKAKNRLSVKEAIQIKAAEHWLNLGEADPALRELEALPSRSWKCSWALKTRIAALGALRGRDEMTAQA